MGSWLITGGAGFIGSNLVHLAARRTEEPIVVLDALTYAGNLSSISELVDGGRIEFVHGSICDEDLVRQTMRRHDVTHVLHLAAESHVDRSIMGPAAFVSTNVGGTACLLQAAHEHWGSRRTDAPRRFLHVSTDEIYGSLAPTDRPFDENTNYRPNSPYAASKASSDHLVRAWHHTFGLPAIITNCSNNYGPRQIPEKLIPLMILNAFESAPLPVYGDGMQVRDWLHVADHCEALLLVLEHGRVGETYCIGGECEHANLDIVRRICEIVDDRTGRSPGTTAELIVHVTDRPGHDRRYATDPAKIRRELSWQAQRRLETSLPEVVDWYLENMAWCTAIRDGSYRDFYRAQYQHRTSPLGNGAASVPGSPPPAGRDPDGPARPRPASDSTAQPVGSRPRGTTQRPYLSVVVPVFLAENILPALLERLTSTLEPLTAGFEIILVCDGSPDRSWQVMQDLAGQYPRLVAVNLSRNFGQHYALTAGLDLAQGEWTVVMDCDLQDPPEEIPRLLAMGESGFDTVIARRIARKHTPWKRLSSRLFARVFSLLSGHRLDSSTGSFRIMRRPVVDALCSMRETYRMFAGLVEWLGFRTGYLDVQHAPRYEGKSSYNLARLLRMAMDGLISFSNRPLYVSVALGMLISVVSGAYGTSLLVRALFVGVETMPGWLSTMTATSFIGGLILLNQGVLGIYVGRMYNQTKGRPLYVIDRIVQGSQEPEHGREEISK